MHGSLRVVISLDPEIERTARKARRALQQSNQIEESVGETLIEQPQFETMAEEQVNRNQQALRDFALLNVIELQTSIARPAVNANNFEIKPVLIQMTQQDHFRGKSTEDPNSNLANFSKICDTMKFSGVSDDVTELRLFQFSLYDKAVVWLNSHAPNSFTKWADLSKAFLKICFPLAKMAKLRIEITGFAQQEGESLYETWKRWKELQWRYPHHGLPEWLIVQTCYNGLIYPTRVNIDVAAGGALMGKSAEEAQQLIEEMTANNYQWANERGSHRRSAIMYEVDLLNLLSAKLDNMLNSCMDNFERLLKQGASTSSNVSVAYFSICGVNHDEANCFNVKQVQ